MRRWIAIALNIGYLTSDRNDNELYTPFYVVDQISKYLPKNKTIWCPFDEEWSAFYVRLKELGYSVIRSSLADGKNFFDFEPDEWDIIVSNPPFSIKDQVIQRLYSFQKPFAILLPLNSLQGKSRYKYFAGGVQLLSFDARIGYHDHNNMQYIVKGSPFASAFFCKDLLPRDLIVEKLNVYERSLV